MALAFVLKPESRKVEIEEDLAKITESREYNVNNRLMSAKEGSSSGCELLFPPQTYPDVFRKWYWRNSYQGCVFKASAPRLKDGINIMMFHFVLRYSKKNCFTRNKFEIRDC